MKNKIGILITGLIICFCFVSLVNAEPPICGDGVCVWRADGTGENCESCPQDCPCPQGFVCDPSDPNADEFRGCVGSVFEGCIETFYIEDDSLPANGTITKIWFKILYPGNVEFDILLDDEECPDVKKCGGFIPGSGFDEDVVNYAYYKAPVLEPTKELSGTMTLVLRLAHVQSGDYKLIPVTIDIGEYVPPEPIPKPILKIPALFKDVHPYTYTTGGYAPVFQRKVEKPEFKITNLTATKPDNVELVIEIFEPKGIKVYASVKNLTVPDSDWAATVDSDEWDWSDNSGLDRAKSNIPVGIYKAKAKLMNTLDNSELASSDEKEFYVIFDWDSSKKAFITSNYAYAFYNYPAYLAG